MSAIRKRLDEGEALLLLVVVIIIGILAAIAIPVFMNQRESAWQSAAESDVRNAAIAVETYYTQEREYPPDAAAMGTDWVESEGVSLTYTPVGDNAYTITAVHANLDGAGPHAEYDSAAGGLQ